MKRSLQIAEQRQKRKRKIYPTEYRVPYNKKERKENIHPFDCRVPKNSKEREENLPQLSMQRNRGEKQDGKD